MPRWATRWSSTETTAQSGIVGSADILSDLGMDIDGGDAPEEFFARHNFVFMLAPHYHPALKGIGKVRRELKVPTIFNLAGPLVEPGRPGLPGHRHQQAGPA